MTETLEQIALRIAEELWGSPHAIDVEFAKRLVEALNAQEPDCWYDKHGMVTHDFFEGVTPLYAAPKPGEVK